MVIQQSKSNAIQRRTTMYGIDPFSAQNATKDDSNAPSIFGALPYPGSSSSSVDPPLHTLVTFRFTSLNPTILDSSVVGPNNETYFRVATSGQGVTLVKNAAGQNIALIEWRSHPTVEAQAIGAKQHVAQWLHLSSDNRCVVAAACLGSGSYSPATVFPQRADDDPRRKPLRLGAV